MKNKAFPQSMNRTPKVRHKTCGVQFRFIIRISFW